MSKVLIALIAMVTIVQAVIYVQPQPNVEKVSFRIGELGVVNYPSFNFQNIYAKWAYKVQDNYQQTYLTECRSKDGQISFDVNSTFTFDVDRVVSDVIYNFEDLKYSKGVLDALVLEHLRLVYVALEDANIIILQFGDTGLNLVDKIAFPDIGRLPYGRFIYNSHNNDTILFVAAQAAYAVRDTIVRLTEYTGMGALNAGVALPNNYIALANGLSGVNIYLYSNSALTLAYSLDKGYFKRETLNVNDVAFNATTSTLYVLDEDFGVLMVNITIDAQNNLQTKLLTIGIRQTGCDNLLLFNETVYITCKQVYKIKENSIVKLPNPLFKVKEIFAYGGFLMIIGQNMFKVYHQDSLVRYQDYFNMDKFFMFDRFYLAVSQTNVNFGYYDFEFPSLVCYAGSTFQEGVINLVVKTEAECSQEYFKKYNITLETKDSDICIYSTPVQVTFWQASDINNKLLIIITLLLVAVVIGMLVWAYFVKRGHRQLEQTLDTYINVNSSQKGYDVMVEEKEEKVAKVEEAKQEVQLQVQHHEIGQ